MRAEVRSRARRGLTTVLNAESLRVCSHFQQGGHGPAQGGQARVLGGVGPERRGARRVRGRGSGAASC